jgi:predicted GNAT superfamily acetyltransferase
MKPEIEIRECADVNELTECVRLQREVFALPEIEISPVRHFIVTRQAGGFTLGAFAGEKLVGFVLSVAAFFGNEKFFYSHMTAVTKDFQSSGIGARLKWAQREQSLKRGVNFIKWTFQPVQARNAFFNLEKLGAVVRRYEPNFYGTDYSTSGNHNKRVGLDSDRLFAEWHLESRKVERLANGEDFVDANKAVKAIEIPVDWNSLVKENPEKAVAEQTRVREEFQSAFADRLTGRGFERSETNPKFLLYEENI